MDCYVLDNNGFVIVSESPQDAGRFFGEVKPLIMSKLVDEKVYRSVHITDYQAVCFVETGTSNPAPSLLTVNISLSIYSIFLYSDVLNRYFFQIFIAIYLLPPRNGILDVVSFLDLATYDIC